MKNDAQVQNQLQFQDTLSFPNCQIKYEPIILTGKIWTDGKVQIRTNRVEDSLKALNKN